MEAFCASRASTLVVIAPPMFRVLPHWYKVGLPEILIEFSSVMSASLPSNLRLINSFATPEFKQDGVHLTDYSGLRYVVHLFDAARAITKTPLPMPELESTIESIRVVNDRVAVLEQGQAILSAEFSMKSAIDAELDEYMENVRSENSFLISGLPGPESGLDSRDWQKRVKRMVEEKIQLIIGRQAPISHVQNATGSRKDGIKVFLVTMVNFDDSKLIRNKFGSFFKAGASARPAGLMGLSVRIRLTLGTRIRIEIMKLLADRYRASNPGSKTQVVNYESRPTMKFTPAPNAADRRPLHFTYIKAVTKLPVNFTTEELAPIYKLALTSSELTGKLRSTFIVLHDEVAREMSRSFSASRSQASGPSSTVPAPVIPGLAGPQPVPQPGHQGHRGGRGGGRGHPDHRSNRSSGRMEQDRSRSRSPLRGQNDS